eukprot:TRINITY_DN1739_c0_g1_i1.p1 TRINITY_DN1739_c0_g1~~TRINITY_DN1739_c0_g1_i1.p1  ORF type:complete len:697 (+),score=133.24 TRINITY_DN1739_c0_g1_i1:135-2225(+)
MGRRNGGGPRGRAGSEGDLADGGGAHGSWTVPPAMQYAGGGDAADDDVGRGGGGAHPPTISVVDPATKQKVTLQWADTQHTTGRQNYLDNLAARSRRDSYLCMLHQKGMCRSHHRCNQVHGERERVQELRERFFSKHGKPQGQDEPLAHQRVLEVIVIDPADPQNRLVLPYAKTSDTLGRREFFQGQRSPGEAQLEAKVCPRALAGTNCPDGSACAFIHAEKQVIRHTKERRPCCPFHGDGSSRVDGFRGRCIMVNKSNQRCPVPVERVAGTKGFREVSSAQSGQVVVACNRVCRLHQEKRCPWGPDCANLHLCREFYAMFANCPFPSIQSLPSQPGLIITSSGKVRPGPAPGGSSSDGDEQGDAAEGGAGTLLTSGAVTGLPLQGIQPKQGLGIPLVTTEGPVPQQLLPPQAQSHQQDAIAAGRGPAASAPPVAPSLPWGAPGQMPLWGFPGLNPAAYAMMWSNMAAAYGGMPFGPGCFPPGLPGAGCGPVWPPPGDVGVSLSTPAAAAPPVESAPAVSAYQAPPPMSQPTPAPAEAPAPPAPPPAPGAAVPESLRKVSYADSEPSHTPPTSPHREQGGQHASAFPSLGGEHGLAQMMSTMSTSSVPPLLQAGVSGIDSFYHTEGGGQSHHGPFQQPYPAPSGVEPHFPQQAADQGRLTPVESFSLRPEPSYTLRETRSARGQHLPYGVPDPEDD